MYISLSLYIYIYIDRYTYAQVKPWSGPCADVLAPLYAAETGEQVAIGRQAMLTEEASP